MLLGTGVNSKISKLKRDPSDVDIADAKRELGHSQSLAADERDRFTVELSRIIAGEDAAVPAGTASWSHQKRSEATAIDAIEEMLRDLASTSNSPVPEPITDRALETMLIRVKLERNDPPITKYLPKDVDPGSLSALLKAAEPLLRERREAASIPNIGSNVREAYAASVKRLDHLIETVRNEASAQRRRA